MEHIFIQGTNEIAPVFLLLHGPGGTERDLIPLTKKLNPEAAVLSVRGNVSVEEGKYYFFDVQESEMDARLIELNNFLQKAAIQYNFNRNHIVALGLLEGANIAVNLLSAYENALKGAILYHPSVLKLGTQLPNLSDTSVFIGAGENNLDKVEELQQLLQSASVDVTLHTQKNGRYLTGELFAASKAWYEREFLS